MRRTDSLKGGGALREQLKFYTVADLADASRSTVATPTFAYNARANVAPFQGLESRDADRRVVGEVWYTVYIRYQVGRVPVEGMRAQVTSTGEWLEVKGSQHIDYAHKKVELTCRLLRPQT